MQDEVSSGVRETDARQTTQQKHKAQHKEAHKTFALFSLREAESVLPLAKALLMKGIGLLATRGTRERLAQHGVEAMLVEDYTGVGEIAQGRVKTLHPRILGGILCKRGVEVERLPDGNPIFPIDYVIVQPYPFHEVAQSLSDEDVSSVDIDKLHTYIDIGGITLLRAAARNYRHVCALYEQQDCDTVTAIVSAENERGEGGVEGRIDEELLRMLASKVFQLTALNDMMISEWLGTVVSDNPLPMHRNSFADQALLLRYGENPHQAAALFSVKQNYALPSGFQASSPTLSGHSPSYNNLLDAYKATCAVLRQSHPTCAIVKHGNLCGFAQAETLLQAYRLAYKGDSLSAYGGIVAVNRPCDEDLLEALKKQFFTLVTAPSFAEDAMEKMAEKANPPLLLPYPRLAYNIGGRFETRSLGPHLRLIQTPNDARLTLDDIVHKNTLEPTAAQKAALLFAFDAASQMTSNAIAIVSAPTTTATETVNAHATLGLGCGQTSRIDAVEIALHKARREGHDLKGCVAASDGFFPFTDSLDALAKAGITAVLHPGGGKNDALIVEHANNLRITLCSTGGVRAFSH